MVWTCLLPQGRFQTSNACFEIKSTAEVACTQVAVTLQSWPNCFFPGKSSHRTANCGEVRVWKNNTENIKPSLIMLAHSPETCENATSSNTERIPEKERSRKENAFPALTFDVPVFHTLCSALVTLSPAGGEGTGRAAEKVTA